MLAKRRSCNESATQRRILVSSTTIIRTWWVFIDLKMNSASDIFNQLEPTSAVLRLLWISTSDLTLPISARDTRYQSAVRIQEQPWIYLPRFSWIRVGRRKATAGSPVIYGEESKVDWSRRSAARYLVSSAISASYWPLMITSAVKGFVLFWTMLGLYCHWKWSSLRWRGQEKVSLTASFKS